MGPSPGGIGTGVRCNVNWAMGKVRNLVVALKARFRDVVCNPSDRKSA